jgi:pimeloyl-ACP methyl ester carboxylesterase
VSPTLSLSSRDIDVSGLSIHLNEMGAGAPVLVLHHSTGPLLGAFHDELACSSHVIAADLPGYGQSARPVRARSPRDLAVYVSQLITTFDLEAVHLVGLGLGGWVAAEVATMNQSGLATLTLVGAAGIKPRTGFIHDPMLNGYIEYMRAGFSRDVVFDEVFGSEPSKDLIDLWDYSREMTARLTWKQWMWNLVLPDLIRGVRTPTLLVWGSEDRIVPLDCAERYLEGLPNARLQIVEGAGHLVELEQPLVVAQLVSDAIAMTQTR